MAQTARGAVYPILGWGGASKSHRDRSPRGQAPPPTPPLKERGEIAAMARHTPIVTPASVPGSTPPQAQRASLNPPRPPPGGPRHKAGVTTGTARLNAVRRQPPLARQAVKISPRLPMFVAPVGATCQPPLGRVREPMPRRLHQQQILAIMCGIKFDIGIDQLLSIDTKNGRSGFSYRSPLDRLSRPFLKARKLSVGKHIRSVPRISFPSIGCGIHTLSLRHSDLHC